MCRKKIRLFTSVRSCQGFLESGGRRRRNSRENEGAREEESKLREKQDCEQRRIK